MFKLFHSLLYSLSRLIRHCSLCCILIFLTACTLNQGSSEFLAYREAFENSRVASQSLFDVLENAERQQQKIVAVRALKGEFDPNSAYLYTELASPPLTNEYRLSFNTISRYNQLMISLVTGVKSKATTEDVQSLAASIVSLPTEVIGTAKFNSASAFLPILGAITEFSLKTRNRKIFSQALSENSQSVIELMQRMRNGSNAIFKFLKASSEKDQAILEKLVADWVVMMDRNISTLRQAKIAVQKPHVSSADISVLRTRVQEISEAARSVREGLARISN